jgi:hypothetical protein
MASTTYYFNIVALVQQRIKLKPFADEFRSELWQSKVLVLDCCRYGRFASTYQGYLIMRRKTFCGAYARSTGKPCHAGALRNGRCRMHGGLSTGPKTAKGRRAVAEATRQRMLSGQRIKALEGYKAWLDTGGREQLSKLAINRCRRKRLLLEFSSMHR